MRLMIITISTRRSGSGKMLKLKMIPKIAQNITMIRLIFQRIWLTFFRILSNYRKSDVRRA